MGSERPGKTGREARFQESEAGFGKDYGEDWSRTGRQQRRSKRAAL